MSLLAAARTVVLLVEPINNNECLKLPQIKSEVEAVAGAIREQLEGVQVELTSPEFSIYSAIHTLPALVTASKSVKAAKVALQAAVDLAKGYAGEPIVDVEVPAVTRLQEVEQEIKAKLIEAGNAYLAVGALLVEAREDFDRQVDFLVWAEEKVGLKKASVFAMIQLYKKFGSDCRFADAPWTVLRQLLGATDEALEVAADLHASGELNRTNAKQLKETGTVDAPAEETAAPVSLELPTTDAPPFDYGTTLDLSAAPAKAQTPAAVDDKDAYIADLLAQITRLVENQDQLFAQLTALKAQPKAATTLPMLPHFKSGCAHTRLGLAADATAKEVRAAYRTITAHYTPESNKEAYDLITEAKVALLEVSV